MSSPSERAEPQESRTPAHVYLIQLVAALSGAAIIWCFSSTLSMVVAVGVLVFILARWKRVELLLGYLGIVLVVLTFWEIRDLEIGAHTHDTYALFLDDYLPKASPATQDAEYFARLKTYENVRWLAENNQYLANSESRPTFPLLRPFVVLSVRNREGIRFVNSYKVELKHQVLL